MTINNRIKQVRKEMHMSQAKFAGAISISNGYIADIELGNRAVNDRIIKLICFTFNVSETWLRSGEGNMFVGNKSTTAELALSTFKELNPEFQEYVLKQISQLLELQEKTEAHNNH